MNRKSKGIYYCESNNKWQCRIIANGKTHTQYCDSYADAVKCRKKFELDYFGEFSYESTINKVKSERIMISLKQINDLETFYNLVEHCRGDVYLCSNNDFEQYNIKSKLLRYIKFDELHKDFKENWKIFCMNKSDENYMIQFFTEVGSQHDT